MIVCVGSPHSTCMERTSTCLGRGGMSLTSPDSRWAIYNVDTQVYPNVRYFYHVFQYVYVYVYARVELNKYM